MGPTVAALSQELAGQIDFYCIVVEAPEHWEQVRQLFKVGPLLPLLALYAVGRWQRSLQGPAAAAVVRPFLTGPLGFDADGNVL